MTTQNSQQLLFNATITPNRSLSKRGQKFLLGFFLLYFIGLGIVFLYFGWWPIVGFLGLDVVGLFIAFKVSNYRARAREKVELSENSFVIRKISTKGVEEIYTFHPMWSRLVYKKGMEDDFLDKLIVVYKNNQVEIGSVLSHRERYDFFQALKKALSPISALSPMSM